MRRSLLIGLLVAACAPPAHPAAGDVAVEDAAEHLRELAAALKIQLARDGRDRVALLPMGQVPAGDGTAAAFLGGRLIKHLHGAGLEVVEREKIAGVIEELAFEQTGIVDPETTSEFGRILGVPTLLAGTATILNGGVDLAVRAVDVETARVVAAGDTLLPRSGEITRVVPATAQTAPAPPLRLSTAFLGERKKGAGYEVVEIGEASTLYSGDGIKLTFETDRAAHAYVLILDSRGDTSVLFPAEGIATSNELAGGQRIEIPPGDQWFFLDENTGTETLYVLASIKPLARIDELLAAMKASAAEDREASVRQFAGEGTTRGIGGIKKGPPVTIQLSDGTVKERTQSLLEGAGAVVRAISFQHR